MISSMISYMIFYIYLGIPILTACAAARLQRPIFPRHSDLMQAKQAMIWTEKWFQTRRVAMLIKALCQTATRKKTMRYSQHF